MKPLLNRLVHQILGFANLSAVRSHQTYESDRRLTIQRRNIDLIIDVGANKGQYASQLRELGYANAILSVEPIKEAYKALEKLMRTDPNWQGINAAAGAVRSKAQFNISADSVCSSLSPPSPTLLKAIPSARIVDTVEVDVIRLDDVALPKHRTKMLKLDVQGYEKEALTGAQDMISSIEVLELELSLKPSYETAYTLASALPDLTNLGFTVTSIGRGVTDATSGQLIDMDVLLERVN